MAKASALAPGMQVRVISGDYENHTVTVVDPSPVPDGQPNQRKVLVSLNDVAGPDDQLGFETYILPRLLDVSRPMMVDASRGIVTSWDDDDEAGLTTYSHGHLITPEPITDPMDPALDRFRPSVNRVKQYISRMVPGGYSDTEYLLALRDQRDANGYSPNVALVGETQSGKTMLVEVLAVLAAERDGLPKPYPVFTLGGSQGVTNYDIYGQTSAVIIDGKEVLVWMEGLAAIAAKAGGFLYLDEWNAVAPGQAIGLHPLLDDRRQFVNTQKAVPDGHGGFSPEVVKANPKLWVLCTINPGYKGTQTMAEATSNRFRWIPWDYDADTEKALIPSKTIRIIGGHLREAHAQRVVTVPIGTSVLQRFNADCATFGVDTAVWSFLGLFPPAERERVRTTIEDTGSYDLLKQEYPEATLKPGSTTVTPGATWDRDALAQQV